MSKIAIFPGSFDPFTNGHLDIVKTAANIFDMVYVIVSLNSDKERKFLNADTMACAIETAIRDEGLTNVEVEVDYGLSVDIAAQYEADYIIRGLRNASDYLYEDIIANVNEKLNSDIKHIYLRSSDAAISSSMVRELMSHDKDVSAYVPAAVMDYINMDKI